MKPKTEHSPLPWKWTFYSKDGEDNLINASLDTHEDGGVLFHSAGWQIKKADAELIVSRVNSGPLVDRKLAVADELVKAISKAIERTWSHGDRTEVHPDDWVDIVTLARQYQAIKEEGK